METKTMKIHNAHKIFSTNYQKLRREDIISICHDKKKLLSTKGKKDLQDLMDKKGNSHFEYYVRSKGKNKIILTSI